jgi:hypothetical protein
MCTWFLTGDDKQCTKSVPQTRSGNRLTKTSFASFHWIDPFLTAKIHRILNRFSTHHKFGCQRGYHRVWIVRSSIAFVDFSFVDLIFIPRYFYFVLSCNPVYVRYVDSSTLDFSLSSHRPSFMSLVFRSLYHSFGFHRTKHTVKKQISGIPPRPRSWTWWKRSWTWWNSVSEVVLT